MSNLHRNTLPTLRMLAMTTLIGAFLVGCASTHPIKSAPIQSNDPDKVLDRDASMGYYRLAQGRVSVTVSQNGKGKYTVSATPIIEGDPTATFTLDYDADAQASDKISVGRNANGVIENISLNTQDESGNIIREVARFVGAVSTFSPADGGVVAPLAAPPAAPNCTPLTTPSSAQIVITPSDKVVSRNIGQSLGFTDDTCATISVEPIRGSGAFSGANCQNLGNGARNGILFRPVGYHNVNVQVGTFVSRELSVTLPDNTAKDAEADKNAENTELGCLPFRRYTLVNTEMTVGFESGAPSDISLTKPSSTLAAVRLPLEVITAVLEVPASLLTLRVENTNAETALIQASMAQQEALKAAIDTAQTGNNP